MRKLLVASFTAAALLALAACGSAPQTLIQADAGYSVLAEAEVAYAKSGTADPVVASKLQVADNTLYGALKALSTAYQNGDTSALALALTSAKAELGNIGPIINAINNPGLSAALATIQSNVAAIQAPTQSRGN